MKDFVVTPSLQNTAVKVKVFFVPIAGKFS